MNDNDKEALVTEYVNKLKHLDKVKQELRDIEVFRGIIKKLIERNDGSLFTNEEYKLLTKMFDFYINEKLKPAFDKSDDDM